MQQQRPAYGANQPVSGNPYYAQQPQYAQPQYAQPTYAQPQYGQQQYAQPQYGQPNTIYRDQYGNTYQARPRTMFPF